MVAFCVNLIVDAFIAVLFVLGLQSVFPQLGMHLTLDTWAGAWCLRQVLAGGWKE